MRSISFNCYAVAAAMAIFFCAGSALATDISGVKLGMTVGEAKASFTKPPSFTAIPVHTNDVESGFAGLRPNPGNNPFQPPADEFLAFKGVAEKIWFVQRHQRFAAPERFGREALVEAVRKKFGKESFFNGDLSQKHGTAMMGWEFKENGQQFFGPIDAPCTMNSGGDRFLPLPMTIMAPTEFKRSCSRAFYAEWEYDADGLVKELSLRAIDSAAMLRAIDGKSARDEAESRQRAQQQLNKGAKPNL